MAVVVQPARRTGRVTRSPRHTFQLRHRPFLLQPFMLAPVLPGETMKSLLLQSRAVTSPIANPLVGWWLEYYFFYVKHRDLDGREDFTEMMLDMDKDMSAYNEAAAPLYYHMAGRINWAKLCLKRITEEYFRNEDETWNANAIDGMPVVQINGDSVLNSAVLDDDFELPSDVAVPIVDTDTVAGADAVLASDIDAAMRTYMFQRANNMTSMDYEDWLATYGITPKPAENHRPELLRYIREWQYPSNTVNPADGVPSSAVSWAVAERADKDRFFREPGFLFGVTVARPKVYLRNQDGSVADTMQDAIAWHPAILRDDPWTSVRKFAETAGPFSVVTDAGGYWLDLKDLLIYGDQFLNFAPAGVATGNLVDLPTAGLNVRYPDGDDLNALFADAGANTVSQDGVVQLSILGAQADTTPNLRRLN